MTACTVTEQHGLTVLTIAGRVDSMTSPDIQRHIDELILSGRRLLVADLEQTGFISSAGLRIFLLAQKQLKNAGGEMILYRLSDAVMPVFKTSGFDRIFKIISSQEELAAAGAVAGNAAEMTAATEDGTTFRYRETSAVLPGTLSVIGSQQKLASASYDQDDVITVFQEKLRFGTGLATAGEEYEEYSRLFGEALFINKDFYFYPAVKRPAVDFMLYAGSGAGTACRFLHGFSFDGSCRYRAAFDSTGPFITLDSLVQWALSLPSDAPLLGIVLLAESKGVLGMNLKQVPLRENRPSDGRDIFDTDHFPSWINFPVEPAENNHIIAAAGIACREKGACSSAAQTLFSQDARFHLHAGIFEKGPISKNIDDLDKELVRVLHELEITKVQHLLGRSRFSSGLLGVMELKG